MLDYSVPALTAAAGRDPWRLATAVTDAHPETVRYVGQMFTARGADALAVAHAGRKADSALAAAHTVDGRPVFDATASGAAGRTLLSDDGATLSETGAVFGRIADDLTTSQTSARTALQAVTDEINTVIAARNAFVERSRGLSTEDLDAADRGFHADAVARVTAGAARIQGVLDAYDDQAALHATRLEGLPQPPPQPPPVTGTPPAPGPLDQAGAITADVVNSAASFGNAIVHNPLVALGFAGGVVLTGVSALGVGSGALATAAGVGAGPGLPVAGASLAGLAAGVAAIGLAGNQLTTAAHGADRVTPLGANAFGDSFPAGAVTAPTMIDAAGNEWDRNGTWKSLSNAIPKGEDIEHTPTSRTHIPYGQLYPNDDVGGGHLYGSGVEDATVFPEDWEAEQILDQVLDVARNPRPGTDAERRQVRKLGGCRNPRRSRDQGHRATRRQDRHRTPDPRARCARQRQQRQPATTRRLMHGLEPVPLHMKELDPETRKRVKARARALSTAIRTIFDVLGPKLPPGRLKDERERGYGGEWGLTMNDVCATLVKCRIPLTLAERDLVAQTLEVFGPHPMLGERFLGDPAGVLAHLTVIDDDGTQLSPPPDFDAENWWPRERATARWGRVGGHMHDTGIPHKTTFPATWSAEKINAQVLDVARNPDRRPIPDRNGNWITRGTRDGVEIEVRLTAAGPLTGAYPLSGLGVHVNDVHGNPTTTLW